jgi:putative transposase
VLRSNPVPRKIVTDQLRSYPAAKTEIEAFTSRNAHKNSPHASGRYGNISHSSAIGCARQFIANNSQPS